jgi:hypothetical protein
MLPLALRPKPAAPTTAPTLRVQRGRRLDWDSMLLRTMEVMAYLLEKQNLGGCRCRLVKLPARSQVEKPAVPAAEWPI